MTIAMKEHVDFGAANFRKYTEDIEKGKLKVFIMIKVKIKDILISAKIVLNIN